MNLRDLLPSENYYLSSNLSNEEIIKRLEEVVSASPKIFSIFSSRNNLSSKLYRGIVDKNKFEITRIITYRNSFNPVILGEISDMGIGNNTEIHIKMKPANFVLVFMSIWLGGVGLGCASITIGTIMKSTLFSFAILIPYLMFVFGILLITIGFKVESKKSKKILEKLFNGVVVK